ncbi:hypothetical protein Hanom_Chr09g00844111 [Helianthus anomalus]
MLITLLINKLQHNLCISITISISISVSSSNSNRFRMIINHLLPHHLSYHLLAPIFIYIQIHGYLNRRVHIRVMKLRHVRMTKRFKHTNPFRRVKNQHLLQQING